MGRCCDDDIRRERLEECARRVEAAKARLIAGRGYAGFEGKMLELIRAVRAEMRERLTGRQ